jgi:hypothetical protein
LEDPNTPSKNIYIQRTFCTLSGPIEAVKYNFKVEMDFESKFEKSFSISPSLRKSYFHNSNLKWKVQISE